MGINNLTQVYHRNEILIQSGRRHTWVTRDDLREPQVTPER